MDFTEFYRESKVMHGQLSYPVGRLGLVGERGLVCDAGVVTVDARVEHVGSLLRPRFLRDARDAYVRGELTPAEFKSAEDQAVREVVAMQEELGLPVVNDGEMRRESFQSELTAACEGFTGVDVNAWLWGEWHSAEVGDLTVARPEGLAVTALVRKRRNLAAEEFTFLRGCTSAQAKVTLPSPSLFANLWSPKQSAATYPTLDAFLADVVRVLCDEAAELVRLGCTYIQLDAPHYPLLIDPGWRAFYEERGWPAERWLGYGIELDNAVIDAGRPATFGFHLCRGNQLSRWLVAGGYDAIAAPVFRGVHADRLLLEYDDRRSGTFDPLRLVPDSKVVVLGLVTTKTPQVEPLDQIKARLREASSLIDPERLALSPQCGFATSVAGNAITPQAQRAKLALLVRAAHDFLPAPTT
ncbi:MAG TPA: cobalamin-independent methionine synthase II family protein [Streptosporangiaceae bacterium]|nr:cobalamin-independent methionine synthase II family protein [Streptosporangiaceae bacterium]